MIEPGDWIENKDHIFEVVKILGPHYLLKEVLYTKPTLQLCYGPEFIISQSDIIVTKEGEFEWESYLIPFVNTLPGTILEAR